MAPRRLLVLGRSGQVARAVARRAAALGWEAACVGRAEADLSSAEIAPLIAAERPALVINAAAYTAVDRAEAEPEAAEALNAGLPARTARDCASAGVPLVHISTDYVFDGAKPDPYVETDPLAPLGVYGRTKAAGEAAVLAAGGPAAIVRTAWVYGPDGANFLKTMLRLAADREEVRVVDDQVGCPTAAADVAEACLRMGERLLAGEAGGVLHAAGAEAISWCGFAQAIFDARAARGGAPVRAVPIPTADYPTPAVRPANSRLDSRRLYGRLGWAPAGVSKALPAVFAALDAGGTAVS